MNGSQLDESESGLIGALMIQPSIADVIQSEVSASDFAHYGRGRVFAFLLDMRDAGKPIDNGVAVALELKAAKLLDEIGGYSGMMQILRDTPNASAAIYHARQVRRAATMRRLAALGAEMQESATDPTADPGEIIRRIDAMASQLGAANESSKLVTIEQAAREAIARMQSASEGQGPAVPTGIYSLDARTGGFYPGDLVILAARPSIGKSALAAQIAMHNAGKGRSALFVSLEMDAPSIAARELAGELGCEVRRIRAGKVTPIQKTQAEAFADHLKGVPLRIHYGRSATVSQVRGLSRLIAAKPEGLALVVVDYIGLMNANDRRKPRWEQVSEISSDLKTLAQELNVPVLACCQLGREAEGKPPTLAQLRDSGAIEQDADVVLLLHRESRDATAATLNVAKYRNGATFELPLGFEPATTSFVDLEATEV